MTGVQTCALPISGDGHNNIKRQDSLKNPSKIKYDVVLTNMPFSLGTFEGEYSNKYALRSSNGNSLCVEHCFDAIDDNSKNPRIGMIVPEGILFDSKFKKLREYIYRNSYVQNIISLPAGAFKPYTDVKTSIIYLTKVNQQKKLQKYVWHFTVNNDGLSLNSKRERKEGDNDLDVFLSFNGTENENTLLEVGFNKIDMEKIKTNNFISIPNPYKKFNFNSNIDIVVLSDLVQESNEKNTINLEVWSVTNSSGFVKSENRFNERVASENTENYKIISPNSFAYNPSRINVGSIAFNDSQNKGCVSPMYVVFKIKDNKRLNSKYFYYLLQSKKFKDQIGRAHV